MAKCAHVEKNRLHMRNIECHTRNRIDEVEVQTKQYANLTTKARHNTSLNQSAHSTQTMDKMRSQQKKEHRRKNRR